MKVALTIAGSDSGGGAGIQADLRTFHQFGVHGTTVVTAITAQNTLGVHAVHDVPAAIVRAQLDAVAGDLPPDAVKTGMLATPDLVSLAAHAIRRYQWTRYVLDPVMVATSGHRLLVPEAEALVRNELMPLAAVVTPNLAEAAVLSGQPVADEADMRTAGHRLLALGPRAVLLKGGHLAGDTVVDLLMMRDGERRFERPRLATRSTHGTGCTLSAAITAGLALGDDLPDAVAAALDYVHRAIAAAPGLGSEGGNAGHGPLNHTVPARTPSMSRPSRSPT